MTSLVKRPARTKLKDKLEGVNSEELQAVWRQCSLSVPRHVRTPPHAPLRATECDTLSPAPRTGTWFGRTPTDPSCPVAGWDRRCWEGLGDAMLAAREKLQAGGARVRMELVGHASAPALPAAFCGVSSSASKWGRRSLVLFLCKSQRSVSWLLCMGLADVCPGLPGVGELPQFPLTPELLAQQGENPPPGFPVPRRLLHSKVPCIKRMSQSGKPLSCTVSFLFSSS